MFVSLIILGTTCKPMKACAKKMIKNYKKWLPVNVFSGGRIATILHNRKVLVLKYVSSNACIS